MAPVWPRRRTRSMALQWSSTYCLWVAAYARATREPPALPAEYGEDGSSRSSSANEPSLMVPYSSSVPTWRKRPTPARRAASARVATPTVLVRTASSGSTIERSTWGPAAGVGELVEVGHLGLGVGGEQVADVVGADEAGPAGHEEAHGGNSWSVG